MLGDRTNKQFFEYLEQHVLCSISASATLSQVFTGDTSPVHAASEIKDFEHKGDQLIEAARMVVDRTFMMQFDHEDNGILLMHLDEVLDGIDAAACRMKLYHSVGNESHAEQLSLIIVEMLGMTKALLPNLRHLDRPAASELIKKIRQHEKRADRILEDGIEALHQKNSDTPLLFQHIADVYGHLLMVFEWEKIIELLEEVTDQIEDVADTIERIIRKYALA